MFRILTVVPARAGSKGVPGKNLRMLGDAPLIVHGLRAAKACRVPMRIVLSTDSEEAAALAEAEGVEVPFVRPAALAGDEINLIQVARHACDWAVAEGWPPDIVVSLQATAPFTPAKALDAALERMIADPSLDSAVSVAMVSKPHPFRTYHLDKKGELAPLTEYTSEVFLQKQDRPDAYFFTGGFFARRRAVLEAWTGRDFALGTHVHGEMVTAEEAVDIDSPLDFLLCEAVLRDRETRLT